MGSNTRRASIDSSEEENSEGSNNLEGEHFKALVTKETNLQAKGSIGPT
jgi:hypothetical protein